jgi:hypothetical protein
LARRLISWAMMLPSMKMKKSQQNDGGNGNPSRNSAVLQHPNWPCQHEELGHDHGSGYGEPGGRQTAPHV